MSHSANALRISVIGAGDWSARMHLPALQRLAGRGEVICPAVCDLDGQRAADYAASVGADQVFTDAAAMLDAVRPDGAVIVVSTAATPEIISLAASRGLPFLVEKPPATDGPTHRRLIERVGELTHLVGYNRRFAPYIERARHWLAGQTIQSVTAIFSRFRRHDPDFSTTAVHAIDTAGHLAGSPFAELRVEVAPAGAVRNFFLNGWTRGGARIDILVTPDAGSAVEHYIVRSADRAAVAAFPQGQMIDLPGYVELHEQNRLVARLGPGDLAVAPEDLATLRGIVSEHEMFCRAVRGEPAVRCTLATTLQVQEISDEIRRLAGAGGRNVAAINFARPVSER